MVVYLYVLLNAALVVVYVKWRSGWLHPLETVVYGFAGTIMFQNYSALLTMNLARVFISSRIELELAHVLNRLVLYPLLGLLFLSLYAAMATPVARLACTAAAVMLLTAAERLEGQAGIFVHMNWPVWYSVLYWCFFTVALVGFRRFFRAQLLRQWRRDA
ncbi:hypothetical protein B5M42_015125 [Paenibacillus athensensis]|uniref:Uncharacterized protein n=1 Tax=Paenibacillus athensensis TaxID=1967502 RepID=A0A4Y8Q9R7_9BACL|nr:hypothetical protein [Paenibacillus athensensis]MCD1260145.1 hypothetical protein [Paenibacillus athensensis]